MALSIILSTLLYNPIYSVHHFYCPISVDGKIGIAKLYVTDERGGTNRFYLTKIEMVPTDSAVLRYESIAPNSSADTEISVAQIFEFVKQYNDRFERDSENPTQFTPKSVTKQLLNPSLQS